MDISREDMYFMLLTRISGLVDWLIIGFLHLTALLVAVWTTQATPADVQDALLQLAQSKPRVLLGLGGISAATVLALWLRLCFRVTRKLTSRYVWKPVHAAMRK